MIENKKEIEEKLNKPCRLRVATYNNESRKIELYNRFYKVIKDKLSLTDANPRFDNIISQVSYDDRKFLIDCKKEYASCLNDNEALSKLCFKMRKNILLEEVNYLIGNAGDEAKIIHFLKDKSNIEKSLLIEVVVNNHATSPQPDISIVQTNKTLKHFGHKLKRKIIAKLSPQMPESKIKLSRDEDKIFRAVFAGRFFLADSPEDNSTAYKDYLYQDNKKNSYKPQDYDLLKNNPSFQKVKNSQNIRLVAPKMQEYLAKLGVEPKLANQFNGADFAQIICDATKSNDTRFEAINPECIDNPRQEFCKKLLDLPEVCENIKQDFLAAGVSKEYFDFWAKSMRENGDAMPNIGDRKFEGIVPPINIHHKDPLRYANTLTNPLSINDSSNLVMMVQFDDYDVHGEEHRGDVGVVSYTKDFYDKDIGAKIKREAENGDLVVAELFEIAEDLIYKSANMSIDKKIAGNKDLSFTKPDNGREP